MKFLLSAATLFTVSAVATAACNKPVDPKKVVLMLAFHEGGEEVRGAMAGACARGEKLVIIPTASPEARRTQDQVKRQKNIFLAAYRRCASNEACEARLQESDTLKEYLRLTTLLETLKPDFEEQLSKFTQDAKSRSLKVNSLIISGHDGGGEFYGDLGRTDKAKISQLASENPEIFSSTSSLLLMGCWSGVPDQVDQWKAIFPHMRILGGFVGSAPASTRLAAGQYISGILAGEKNLSDNASRAEVQRMISTIQNINQITAGVYINPKCEDKTSRSPAYYYVSPSQNENELSESIKPGLSVYSGMSDAELQCRMTFGHDDEQGTYDWNPVQQYFLGSREPKNNPELVAIYSFLRNSEYCFSQGFAQAPVTPEQVLFLRFFQDMKKNFDKYFKKDLETMYRNLQTLVAASGDVTLIEALKNHKKLIGSSLTGMTRRETLTEISKLTGIFDKLASAKSDAPELAGIRKTVDKLDLMLYRLKCVPATWHEYAEGETLARPTCAQVND